MKTLTANLKHDAIMDDNGDYYAIATLTGLDPDSVNYDFEGEDVRIIWSNINPEDPDERNACDWSSPEGIIESGQWIFDGEIGINGFKGYKVKYINTDGTEL